MIFVARGGRRYGQFPQCAALRGLVHAYTTRPQDVSCRADERCQERAANRNQALTDWGLQPDTLRYCEQVHADRLAVVAATTPPGPLAACDGAATDAPGVPLMSFSADCPLVLLFDPAHRAVAVVHASWRCTVGGLVAQMVALLRATYGSRPAQLHVGIGPGAGPAQYEVQDDVYQAAATLPQRDSCFRRDNGRMTFDLWAANTQLLVAAGVPAAQIAVAGLCTMTHNDVFYSFRREGRGCGHFGLLAAVV